MKVRTRPLLLAAALLAGTVVPLAAPAAADTGPVPLGMATFGDIVVDEAHGRLFISGGPGGDGIRVTDLSGAPVRTLFFTGATGMALSPDGSALWVAQPSFGLVRLDTATLGATQRIPLPTGQCAGDVALVGDRVVYGYSCEQYSPPGGPSGGIGMVDAVTGAVLETATDGPTSRPVVEAGPDGRVYAADAGPSGTDLHVYDVTGTTPVRQAAAQLVCSDLQDLSSAPGGGQVVTACVGEGHGVWSSALQPAGRYFSGVPARAGAWSADGSTFAAGIADDWEPDVYVYRAGRGDAREAVRQVDFGSTAALLQRGGLAASRDGHRVWAVTSTASDTLALHVIDVPRPGSAVLTLAASPQALYAGRPTTLTGRLAAVTGAPVAGVALDVRRAVTGAAPTSLPPVVTAADGSFTFVDTPPSDGSWAYTVTNPLDAAIAETVVVAWATETRVTLDVRQDGAGVYGSLTLGHEGPDQPGTVTVTRTGDGRVFTLPQVSIDSWGGGKFLDSPGPGTWTYTASVAASGVHPAASVASTVTLEPQVATALTLSLPPTATVGSPLRVSGTLSAAGAPVSGASVTVRRAGCGTASWTRSVPTTPNGAWSVWDDAPPAGTCTYSASYAGAPGYASSTASATTTVTLAPTTLGIDTLSPTVAGSPVVVRGTLGAGGSLLAGATVSVARAGCSTVGWQGSAVTTPNGSWSVTDPAAPGGTCTYRASYAGDRTRAAATGTVSATVSFRTTDLTLSVVRGTGGSKKYAYVTAHLGGWHTGKTLRITAQPTGGAEVQVALGAVDGTGRLTATYQPRTTTTYRVTYAGDDWYAPAKAERTQ